MDIIELISKLQGIGIAGLSLAALIITNRFWVRKLVEVQESHKEDVKQVRKDATDRIDQLSGIIDQKNAVIEELSRARIEAGESRRKDLEKFLDRDAQRESRYEVLTSQYAQNVSQMTDTMKELKSAVQSSGR